MLTEGLLAYAVSRLKRSAPGGRKNGPLLPRLQVLVEVLFEVSPGDGNFKQDSPLHAPEDLRALTSTRELRVRQSCVLAVTDSFVQTAGQSCRSNRL